MTEDEDEGEMRMHSECVHLASKRHGMPVLRRTRTIHGDERS
jgi:hypothetical protein